MGWAVIIVLISGLFQVVLWYWVFRHIISSIPTNDSSANHPFVSIVIAVKNEEKNLEACLLSALNQDYPEYEIIAVNDHSTDSTNKILKEMSDKHVKLKVLSLEKKMFGKKDALTIGIDTARGSWIGLTDADCLLSPSWISSFMVVSSEYDILLGYGPYQKEPGSLNKFIRFETWYVAMQFLSLSLAGHTYMGVGRNLFYKKSIFNDLGGYSSHSDLLSGDDDLFISEASSEFKSGLVLSPSSFTRSIPKKTLMEFFRQKRRHISTASSYKPKVQLILMAFALSQISFYTSLIWLAIVHPLGALFTLLIRYILLFPIVSLGTKKLEEKDLLFTFPLLDIFLFIFYSCLSPFILDRPKTWS